ncbi:MAG TPA: hypothetical protein VFE05_02875 [Longimicrobiaceae bacterium]|nr:hypothetical protein [Longimicrobiaceae bacterium]
MQIKAFLAANAAADAADAVGIVVQGARPALEEPCLAFVWGGEARPRPSLPFGRWKAAGRAA